MQLTDRHVLKTIGQWLDAGRDVWLCTIVHTYGSAPRPVGALFASDGERRVGSISGGCLEDAFFAKLQAGDFNGDAELFDYNAQLNRSGQPAELPCGGSIELLVEKIVANDDNITQHQQWLSFANEFQSYERVVTLGSQQRCLQALTAQPERDVVVADDSVRLRYAQVWTLLLLGVSQVSEHVARIALMAGFEVRLCDHREEMAAAWLFDAAAGGVDIEWQDPSLFVAQYAGPRSAVLALAHDPKIDDIGLMAAFDSQAFYIGAMGSMKTSLKRRERLARICQIDETTLARLKAPIGLDIGSKTPVEIAISIMAELIQCKAEFTV